MSKCNLLAVETAACTQAIQIWLVTGNTTDCVFKKRNHTIFWDLFG